MTHIDKYKTTEYFLKYISDQTVRIAKFKKVLEGCGESEKPKIYRMLCDRYKDLISAQFSNNVDMTKIKSCFEEYAMCVHKAGFSCYSEYIDFLSLQIILDIKDIFIVIPKEYDDDLSRILHNFIDKSNNELTGHLYDDRYYSKFVEYCNGDLTFDELMDYVTKKWYKSSMGFYWYDSHLKDYDVYTGYWCYVASAVIKIKDDYGRVSDGTSYII